MENYYSPFRETEYIKDKMFQEIIEKSTEHQLLLEVAKSLSAYYFKCKSEGNLEQFDKQFKIFFQQYGICKYQEVYDPPYDTKACQEFIINELREMHGKSRN